MADLEPAADAASPASARRRALMLAAATVVVGTLISYLAQRWLTLHFDAAVARQTDSELLRLVRELPTQMQRYTAGVYRLREIIVSRGVDEVADRYISQVLNLAAIDADYPAANGFGLVLRDASEEPSTVAHEHDIVTIIEPVERNLGIPGLDIAADPPSARAARRAIDSGQVALTLPEADVQPTAPLQQLFQLYLAIYASGMPLASHAQRDAAAVGWAYATVDAARFFATAGVDGRDFALQVVDVTDARATRPFFNSQAVADGAQPSLARSVTLPVLDRRWLVTVRPTPRLLQEIRWLAPEQLRLLGMALSLLLAMALATLPLIHQRRREQRTYLRLALEAASVGMVMIDRKGTMVFVNSHLLEIFGHSRQELIGQPVEMLVPELAPSFRASLRGEIIVHPSARTMATGKETRGLRHDGSAVSIEVGLNPIQTFEGRYLLASIMDLTERKRAEQIQRQMSALIESAADAILTKDLHGIIQSWNPAAQLLLGYSAEEIIGQPITRLLPADRENEEASIYERVQTQRITDLETVRVGKDGSLVEVSLTISPIRDATGAVVGASTIMRDITERRRAREQFRLALEAAPTGMLVMSRCGAILLVNRQIETIFGYRRDQVLGESIEMLLPERFRARHVGLRSHFFEAPSTRAMGASREIVGLRRDGTEVPVEIMINPFKSGTDEFVLSSIVDLSQRRQIEKLRTDFVSTVSHELRTPLTSISGSLGLLCSGALGKLPAEADAMIQIAHKNSGRLVRIINDILDIGKLEAGQVTLHLTAVPAAELLRQAVEANASLAETYHVQFLLDAAAGNDLAHADPDRLMQVVTNLLSNAAKVSSRGGCVWVRLIPQQSTLRIEVEDRGPGISEAFKAHIFEKFAQADASDTRRVEGSGLGLSISRRLMELMGGSIGFDTVPGHGSIFYLELNRAPLQRAGDAIAAVTSS